MRGLMARHFRKPEGLLGYYVSNRMIKSNFHVYPAIDRFVDIQDNMIVLEIGYGPGIGISYFLDKHPIQMEGLDFSKLMFRRASWKNRKFLKNGRLKLMCGDFSNHDFRGMKYDRVIFANVIYFWNDLDEIFERMKTVLKPDGKMVFYMSDKSRMVKIPIANSGHFNHHDSKDVMKSIEHCGFRNVLSHNVVDDSGDYLVIEAVN